MMEPVGALVTLELADGSPVRDLPWIITFGPLTEDEDWEPVVCGPYQHAHAMALAEDVVADDDLMAVVEPVMSLVTPDEIRSEVGAARAVGEASVQMDAAQAAQAAQIEAADAEAAQIDVAQIEAAQIEAAEVDAAGMAEAQAQAERAQPAAHPPASMPDASEVRAGMARVVAHLAGSGRPDGLPDAAG